VVSSCCAAPASATRTSWWRFFKPLRRIVESIFGTLRDNSTWNDTADTHQGVFVRVLQRLVAMTKAICTRPAPDNPSEDPYSPTTTALELVS
jgi:hypothetical protein